MMKLLPLVVCLAVCAAAFAGCGTVYHLSNTPSKKLYAIDEFNRDEAGNVLEIHFNSGRIDTGRNVFITPDSVSWIAVRTGTAVSVPPFTLDRIIRRNHLRGVVDGALAGIGWGAVTLTGSLLLVQGGGDYSGAYVLYLSPLCPVVGALVGLNAGHTTEYVFPHDGMPASLDIQNRP